MKISIDENNEFLLQEVYTGIRLRTSDHENFFICMRDTGFEFYYGGQKYEAKQGVIKEMVVNKTKELFKSLNDIDAQ